MVTAQLAKDGVLKSLDAYFQLIGYLHYWWVTLSLPQLTDLSWLHSLALYLFPHEADANSKGITFLVTADASLCLQNSKAS